ncbi:hypothetical protein BGZ83_005112 [Gryganskiella cystojenkinii]|nr:hypothetical protein BGZ83_005112 [Gryganskiella cystojenkinii]
MRARMLGFGSKDRRPIDPPPVIQLHVMEDGEPVDFSDTSFDEGTVVANAEIYSLDCQRPLTLVFPPNVLFSPSTCAPTTTTSSSSSSSSSPSSSSAVKTTQPTINSDEGVDATTVQVIQKPAVQSKKKRQKSKKEKISQAPVGGGSFVTFSLQPPPTPRPPRTAATTTGPAPGSTSKSTPISAPADVSSSRRSATAASGEASSSSSSGRPLPPPPHQHPPQRQQQPPPSASPRSLSEPRPQQSEPTPSSSHHQGEVNEDDDGENEEVGDDDNGQGFQRDLADPLALEDQEDEDVIVGQENDHDDGVKWDESQPKDASQFTFSSGTSMDTTMGIRNLIGTVQAQGMLLKVDPQDNQGILFTFHDLSVRAYSTEFSKFLFFQGVRIPIRSAPRDKKTSATNKGLVTPGQIQEEDQD